jgi:hypothetical protein
VPSAKRQRQRENKARRLAGPDLHVKVAHAGGDLRSAADLVKPAILYADKVTIYSPAASLLRSVEGLAQVTDPVERAAFLVQLMDQVPGIAGDLEVPPEFLDVMRGMTALPRPLMRRAMRAGGVASADIDELYAQIDGLQSIWDEQMPEAMTKARDSVGAGDLWVAIDRGAVEVADITEGRGHQAVAESVQAAASRGARPVSDTLTDEIIGSLVKRIVEMVTESSSFPLFDPHSAGLFKALEREAGVNPSPLAMRQGKEVDAAARFMGFLPYFADLPMDEVIDLRDELRGPLTRFRGAMSSIGRDLEARQIDPAFPAEVEAAWRSEVAPALLEIEEALASHGFLREAVSTAIGSPRRIIADAGVAFAATHVEQLSLSGLLAAAATAAVPALDIAAQSLKATRQARADAETQSFYFLHRLGHEAENRNR